MVKASKSATRIAQKKRKVEAHYTDPIYRPYAPAIESQCFSKRAADELGY